MAFSGVKPIKFGDTVKAYKLGAPTQGVFGIRQAIVSARGMNVLSERAVVAEASNKQLLLTRERPEDMLDCIETSPIRHFSQGFAALLAPFANRLPGRDLGNGFQEVIWGNQQCCVPVNFTQEGLAIHGLVYDSEYKDVKTDFDGVSALLRGTTYIPKESWFSDLKIDTSTWLSDGARDRTVVVENIGDECAPVGIGEHPDFKIPKGQPREEVILRIPARSIVRSGANMLPDFEHGSPIVDVRKTNLKGLFSENVKDRRLGDLSLDHCFTELGSPANSGEISLKIEYPRLHWGIQVSTILPDAVNAIQVYSPTDPSLPAFGSIAVEFQTNFADPLNPEWGNCSPLSYVPNQTMPSGMRILAPGEKMVWSVRHSVYRW